MKRLELNDFYNDGFGWICKHCERETKEAETSEDQKRSRLMSEGEAESKTPVFSNRAMAKWQNAAQTILTCPRCEISERVEPF